MEAAGDDVGHRGSRGLRQVEEDANIFFTLMKYFQTPTPGLPWDRPGADDLLQVRLHHPDQPQVQVGQGDQVPHPPSLQDAGDQQE